MFRWQHPPQVDEPNQLFADQTTPNGMHLGFFCCAETPETQHVCSDSSSPHKSMVSAEPNELFGNQTPPNGRDFTLLFCYAETQDVCSDGSSPHKSMVSDEPDEVFGDSIDEEGEVVRQPAPAPVPSTSGMLLPQQATQKCDTGAAWRQAQHTSIYTFNKCHSLLSPHSGSYYAYSLMVYTDYKRYSCQLTKSHLFAALIMKCRCRH